MISRSEPQLFLHGAFSLEMIIRFANEAVISAREGSAEEPVKLVIQLLYPGLEREDPPISQNFMPSYQ